jgi:hypothetical protein
VHYELWRQPHGERTRLVNDKQDDEPRDVLTKPKILPVKIEWLRIEKRDNAPDRYVLSAATYQRLADAVK